MAVDLATVVKQLTDSGIIAPGKLENFIPPKADPKTVEELVQALVKSENLTAFQGQQVKGGKARALILGNYTILDKIGAGGMGQVFKAQHRKMKRLVAIKMLPPAMTKDAAALARFEREVEAAAKLSHPNIVAAHDADEANGAHFLVMEYVEGKDLSALVKKDGPFPVNKAVNYILQAARGLEFAHDEGVVHRDIKPANLLLDKKEVVKILDMGLARIEQADGGVQSELTGTGTIMGTVDYMSPEQALNTKDADQRADIYSLGCSLYYLLAGKAAYGGDTAMQKLMAHQNQPIPSLQEVQTTVSKQLEAVFKKMVAKKIEDRYQTMSEVVEALEGLGFGGSSTGRKGDVASTLDLSSADRKKLLSQAKKKPLGSITEVVASEKSKNLVLKIVGGSFGTIVAPILVFYLIRHLEKEDKPEKSPAAIAPAATVPPVVVATNTTTQPPAHVVDDGSPKPLVAPFDAKQAHAGQAAWAKHLGTTVEQKNPVGMTLVLIPPGEFLMGSTDEQAAAALKVAEEIKLDQSTKDRIQKVERPQHRVVITKPLLMSATEVTVGQFRKFVEATKYVTEAEQYGFGNSGDKALSDKVKPTDRGLNWKSPGYAVTDDCPVAQVTWNDACAYCAWLSEQEQRTPWYRTDGKGGWLIAAQASGYRLPTEAEWEYACRAGTTTQYSFGDDYAELEQYGWYYKNAGGKAQPVALKLPNSFGLFDMHGNLQEWCQDFYDENWYEKPLPNDPKGPSSRSNRAVRGGSLGYASCCRSAYRFSNTPSYRYYLNGFRCVRVWDDTAADSQIARNTTPQPTTPVTPATTSPIQPWNTPAFQKWVKATQALPAEKQIEAVSKKLMELNPGFDGKLTGWEGKGSPLIENGVVRAFGFFTDNVTDISPVRVLSGLKEFGCSGDAKGTNNRIGKLTDLSPLQGMPLIALALNHTQVSDLSSLQGMPLTVLLCVATDVSDLTPLHGMPLSNLILLRSRASDLRPLQGMPLTNLDCRETKVFDLTPLREMKLKSFNCFGTQVSDLSPLQDCKTLISLDARFSKVVTPAQVAALQKALPNCKIEWNDPAKPENGKPKADGAWNTPAFQQWVKATQALPAEQQLEAVSKKLMELNPGFDGKLSGRRRPTPEIENGTVTEIYFYNNAIVDLSPVQALAGLKRLYCPSANTGKGKLSDLSPLSEMNLAVLECHGSSVSDLTPLEVCVSLSSLDIRWTQVTAASVAALQKALPNCKIEWDGDIVESGKPKAGGAWNTPAFQAWVKATQALPAEQQIEAVRKKLMELNPGYDGKASNRMEAKQIVQYGFAADQVTDISPLRALSSIKELSIHSSPQFADLSPLTGMQISRLSCQYTRVTDLSPLAGLPLTYLNLDSCPVADLSPLVGLPLDELNCFGTKVEDISPLSKIGTLRKLILLKCRRITPAQVAVVKKALPNCKIEWDDPGKAENGKPKADGVWNTPAFQAWVKATQALPAEQQIEAVRKKLMELNPEFDGKVTDYNEKGLPKIEGGSVTELGFLSDKVLDISPVRALSALRCLGCNSTYRRGRLADLSPLAGMQLTNFAFRDTQVADLSPLKGMPLVDLYGPVSNVSDLSPLYDCKSLHKLHVESTKVTPAQVAALQKALPNCKIEWHDPAKPKTHEPAAAGSK